MSDWAGVMVIGFMFAFFAFYEWIDYKMGKDK